MKTSNFCAFRFSFRPAGAFAWGSLLALSASQAEELDIAALSLDELMRVEVTTPGKVPETIRDTPASVYLVTRDEIAMYGYQSLSEVLENVPGLYNIDNNFGLSGNFGIRGFWNNRSQNSSVAILINGIPQARPDESSTPMNLFNVPVEAIDRIEISRGPNSVIYGNGASFGAINIITDDSYSEDMVTVSYGSLDTKRSSIRWSEFGDDFHIIVNAGFSRSGGLDYDIKELMSPANQALLPFFNITDENSSLDGRLEQETGHLQIAGAWRDLYFDVSHRYSGIEFLPLVPAVQEGHLLETNVTRLALGYEAALTGDLSWDTRIIYSDFAEDQFFEALTPDFPGFNTRDFNSWELESLFRYKPSADLKVVGGVNLQRMQNFYEFTFVPGFGADNEVLSVDHRDNESIFAQVSYRLSEEWRLVGGYRYEQLGPFERVFIENVVAAPDDVQVLPRGGFYNGTPRASLIYQPSESSVFKLMAGDAIKIPSFPQPAVGNERVRTFEANYTGSSEDFLFSIGIFFNSNKNLQIEQVELNPDGSVESDLISGGVVDTSGVELLLRRNFGDYIRTEFGATWQDSNYEFHPTGIASYSPELVMHGKVSYKKDSFSAAALARYVDSMYPLFNTGETAAPVGFIGDAVDGYALLDLNVRWDDLWQGLFLNVHVTNVFDSEIRYPSNPVNGLLYDRGHIGPGRRITVSSGFAF